MGKQVIFTRSKRRPAAKGWQLIREALQSRAANLPDVVWVDGVLFIGEPG